MSWFMKIIGLSNQTQEVDAVSNAARTTLYKTDGTAVDTNPATSGEATAANQTAANTKLDLIKAKTDNLDVALSTRTKPSDQQHAIIDSSALPTGASTEATLATRLSESDFDTKAGSLTETAPATDTASSGLNGRLQRIAQRLTSLIAFFRLGQGTMAQSLAVTMASDQSTLPVNSADASSSGTITALAGSVALVLAGQSAGTIQVGGTWVGTLQFEGSLDGTTWTAINATAASTSVPATTTAVNGLFRLTPGGLQQFRIVSTAWTSGTATILMRAALGTSGVYVNHIAPVKLYDGTNLASIFPATFLRTTDEPRQVFYDPFDAAPDTTNVWASTTGSSGVAAAVSGGVLSLGTGTTANGFSKIVSLPTFKLPIPGWLGNSFAIALPDGAAPTANAARYWGLFTSPTTPTVAAPVTDGYIFELATNGKMSCVVYAAGVRTLIADLSASTGTGTQPLNASYHRYIIYVRTDKTYFYIDGLAPANLVATTNFQSPAIQTLPTSLLTIADTPTPPASNSQIQCAGLAVWDTGKNATQIADGTFPFRKASVSAAGSLNVNTPQIRDTNNGFTLNATTNRIITVVTTNGSNIITSAALFTSADLGRAIEGTGIPANAIIVAVNSASSVTFKAPPTSALPNGSPATASGSISATIRSGFAGTYTPTRAAGIVRQLVVLGCFVNDGTTFPATLGGTFAFQYSEDGTTATITEVRQIVDFTTVRDLNLINAGAYFRILYTPNRDITANEFVFGGTTNRTTDDGPFVRINNQAEEEQFMAAPKMFSFIKGFIAATGKSIGIRATAAGELMVASSALPSATPLTTGDSGAKTATGNGATQTNVANKGVQLFIILGSVSGVAPTAVFKVQNSVDGGTTWFDVPGAATASLTASTSVGITIYPGITVTAGATTAGTTAGASQVLSRTWRVVWTIGGTTPSFAITSITYNYLNN